MSRMTTTSINSGKNNTIYHWAAYLSWLSLIGVLLFFVAHIVMVIGLTVFISKMERACIPHI